MKVRAAEVNPGTSDLLQYARSHIDGAVMTTRIEVVCQSSRHTVTETWCRASLCSDHWKPKILKGRHTQVVKHTFFSLPLKMSTLYSNRSFSLHVFKINANILLYLLSYLKVAPVILVGSEIHFKCHKQHKLKYVVLYKWNQESWRHLWKQDTEYIYQQMHWLWNS